MTWFCSKGLLWRKFSESTRNFFRVLLVAMRLPISCHHWQNILIKSRWYWRRTLLPLWMVWYGKWMFAVDQKENSSARKMSFYGPLASFHLTHDECTSFYWIFHTSRQLTRIGTSKDNRIIHGFWAAAPKGMKSCRTQGDFWWSICPSISPPRPSQAWNLPSHT